MREDWFILVHLRTCQTCGVTLCCDSSPNRHASKHAHATGHPVIASAQRGERWLYCYPDDGFAEYEQLRAGDALQSQAKRVQLGALENTTANGRVISRKLAQLACPVGSRARRSAAGVRL